MNMTVQNVSKEFPRKTGSANCFTALQPLDLTLEAGKLTIVTGRSGSGKSTLLNLLGGLLQPSSGTIQAGDTDLYALSDQELSVFRNRHIGIIPQGQTAVYSLTVLGNVLLPICLYRKVDEQNENRARSLLERLDIASLADCHPAELSGGELRRMAIARALLMNPEIVLADEPTADLDEENTDVVFRFLKQTAGEGCTVMLVTHEACAKAYADDLYTMQNGKLTGGSQK